MVCSVTLIPESRIKVIREWWWWWFLQNTKNDMESRIFVFKFIDSINVWWYSETPLITSWDYFFKDKGRHWDNFRTGQPPFAQELIVETVELCTSTSLHTWITHDKYMKTSTNPLRLVTKWHCVWMVGWCLLRLICAWGLSRKFLNGTDLHKNAKCSKTTGS